MQNARGRFGEVPGWVASPREGRCALRGAPTTGRPVLPGPPQPPSHCLGVSGPALPSSPLLILDWDHLLIRLSGGNPRFFRTPDG